MLMLILMFISATVYMIHNLFVTNCWQQINKTQIRIFVDELSPEIISYILHLFAFDSYEVK